MGVEEERGMGVGGGGVVVGGEQVGTVPGDDDQFLGVCRCLRVPAPQDVGGTAVGLSTPTGSAGDGTALVSGHIRNAAAGSKREALPARDAPPSAVQQRAPPPPGGVPRTVPSKTPTCRGGGGGTGRPKRPPQPGESWACVGDVVESPARCSTGEGQAVRGRRAWLPRGNAWATAGGGGRWGGGEKAGERGGWRWGRRSWGTSQWSKAGRST